MKIPLLAASILFVSCTGSALASEWSRWIGVGGELNADRSAAVNFRARRDEARDEMEKGYLFVYELHNASGTLTAKVSLSFALQDPATLSWTEIDPDKPTVVHEVPPLGTVTGTRYSPSHRELSYASNINWSEDLPPKTTEEQTKETAENTELGAGSGAADTLKPASGTTATQTEFEGVPLSDNAALENALQRYSDSGLRFRAKIVFQLPPSQWEWMEAALDGVSESYTRIGTWRQYLEYWFVLCHQLDPFKRNSKFQMVSVTTTEMTVLYSDAHINDLDCYLGPGFAETKPLFLELALLEPNAAPPAEPQPEPAEKIVGGTTPEAKPEPKPAATSSAGSLAVAKVHHKGYWFDPGDKDSKAADPVIYVRVAGQLKRVRLSVAKEAYGVPANASRDTMSHYTESQGIVLIDRGTHRP